MRKLQVISVLIFIASVAVFGSYNYRAWTAVDQAGPEITMEEDSITVSAAATEEELLAGVTAVDETDGDVSDTLLVETESNFIEKGRRSITIAAFDSDNHITKASREVIYNDYHSPRFALSAPLSFPVGVQNILSGMSVEDMLDGSLTENIKISGEYSLDPDTPGEYPMLFTVSNSAGDVSELLVTVEIYDPSKVGLRPQIELSRYVVYTSVGKAINPWDYVESITVNGNVYEREEDGILRVLSSTTSTNRPVRTTLGAEDMIFSPAVDYDTPGTYEVICQLRGSSVNVGRVCLIVVVE